MGVVWKLIKALCCTSVILLLLETGVLIIRKAMMAAAAATAPLSHDILMVMAFSWGISASLVFSVATGSSLARGFISNELRP